jgi:hypothetical protein
MMIPSKTNSDFSIDCYNTLSSNLAEETIGSDYKIINFVFCYVYYYSVSK